MLDLIRSLSDESKLAIQKYFVNRMKIRVEKI